MKRRHFLIAGGLVAAGVYINQRGLRYPRMGFEPAGPRTTINEEQTQLNLKDFIATSQQAPITLRAIAPEPSLEFIPQSNISESTKITATNISPKAILRVDAAPNVSVHEQIDGIHRTVELKYKAGQNISLSWFLADSKQLKFAAIGDSGGGSELDWCLTRAEQLGVDFFLHLGDLNYGDGEYDRAIKQINQAAMPVYVTIGNHDFNDSGLVYRQFLDHIGPLNNSFVIAGTRFINVDTAVNFFPAYSGHRGEMLRELTEQTNTVFDNVVFTHKPFVDSREGYTHDISGIGEKPWLRKAMQSLDANDLLCGHVHHNSELEYEGIRQWISGEGLGHEDIVHQKLVSKILVGTINQGQKVNYQWHDLNMPWDMHLSHTHTTKLRNYEYFEQLEWYQRLMQTGA